MRRLSNNRFRSRYASGDRRVRSTSVEGVFAGLIVVPSAPLLVPELVGPQATDTAEVRAAVLAAGAHLAARTTAWLAVGCGPNSQTVSDDSPDVANRGTFARFGVDVAVTLSDDPVDGGAASTRIDGTPLGPQQMPLSMLIAAWLRGAVGAGALTPATLDAATTPAQCADVGTRLRAQIDADPHPIGVVVVGDGCISLTAKSPGGRRSESAAALQQQVDTALATADQGALARLDAAACAAQGVDGRAPWQTAAALVGRTPVRTESLYAHAPFGVGYNVVEWWPR